MNSKTALVVDDSKSARFALRKYLENQGFTVDAVDGAAEAYSFLQKSRPQLIFLDHVMPGIDGFEALQHLKNDPQTAGIPVIICSSNDAADFRVDACNRGALDVLPKPPQTDHLIRILDSLQNQTEVDISTLSIEAFDLAVEPPALAPVPAAPAGVVSSFKLPSAPAPSKVSNIREPEVAIEQAVMKALRGAMQPPPAAVPAPVAPVAPAAEFNPGATGSFNIATPRLAEALRGGVDATQLTALREQMESRLKKLTQELFVQIAELKGALAHLESREPGPTPEAIQQIAENANAGLHQRMDALENTVQARLAELATLIESRIAAPTAQILEAARAAAAEEAHAVSERTMMSAASRIGDQLAETILKSRDGLQRKAE